MTAPDNLPPLPALLPCPFCGLTHTLLPVTAQQIEEEGEDDPPPWMHSESWCVVCDARRPEGPGGCGATGGFYPTAQEAIEAWNRRAYNAGRAAGAQVPTLDLYKRLCDLCDEANAVDTVIGRPEVLRAKLKALRDEIGSMTASYVQVAPAGAQVRDEEPEREILQLIDERDERERVIDAILDAVLGPRRPEWSSHYGFADAVRDVQECIASAPAAAAQPAATADIHEWSNAAAGCLAQFINIGLDVGRNSDWQIAADEAAKLLNAKLPAAAAVQPDLAAVAQEMREALDQMIACHDEPTCPAIDVAHAALARYDALPATARTEPVALTDDDVIAIAKRTKLPRIMWDTESFRSALIRFVRAVWQANGIGGE